MERKVISIKVKAIERQMLSDPTANYPGRNANNAKIYSLTQTPADRCSVRS
jgi:hypothetical protein